MKNKKAIASSRIHVYLAHSIKIIELIIIIIYSCGIGLFIPSILKTYLGKRTKAIKIGYKGDSYLILTNNEKKSNFYGSHTIAMWLNIDPLQRPAYLMDQAAE